MGNIYGLEALSRSLLSGFKSVSLGAGLSVGLAFILWNYLNDSRARLAGPLAALLGLAGGRFLFFSNMFLGNLWLGILNGYIILGGGLIFIWLTYKRILAIKTEDFWSRGLVPDKLFWPSGLVVGLALASLSRPVMDLYSLNLVIFGFKGQGEPLWLAWVLGGLSVLNFALIIFLGGHTLLKSLAAKAVRYRVEQIQVAILSLAGFSLLLKSVNLF